jgi:hypothetical protein
VHRDLAAPSAALFLYVGLRRVGQRFGELRVALNRLRDRLMFPSHVSAEKLMRQVGDEFRYSP